MKAYYIRLFLGFHCSVLVGTHTEVRVPNTETQTSQNVEQPQTSAKYETPNQEPLRNQRLGTQTLPQSVKLEVHTLVLVLLHHLLPLP